MEILSNESGNDIIKNYIKENKLFSVSRVGGVEIIGSCHLDNNQPIPTNIDRALRVNAGMYGNCLEDFHTEYVNGIGCADLQVVWQNLGIDQAQDYLFGKYSKESIKIRNRSVEPFYFDDPWSKELEGKKVLIIHPFSKTIESQYKKRNLLFENKDVLPEFELITYKPVQSIGGQGPHISWKESLDIMKNDISKIDFDIALLGCGSYGLPLVNHIKSIGKSAIYIGGGLQVLFGIKGKRWDNHSFIKELYNENWVYPMEEETPKSYKLIEGGCYWK